MEDQRAQPGLAGSAVGAIIASMTEYCPCRHFTLALVRLARSRAMLVLPSDSRALRRIPYPRTVKEPLKGIFIHTDDWHPVLKMSTDNRLNPEYRSYFPNQTMFH